MELTTNKNGSSLTIHLEGRLDTTTAPLLEKALNDYLEGIDDLTLDFDGLAYVSSAGLRSILQAQKTMNKQGHMRVVNVDESVREVFEITGFSNILTIE